MSIREEILEALDRLSEESLEGVLEYVRFIQEPEEVEPTEEGIAIIARSKAEIDSGDLVEWRDLKKELDKMPYKVKLTKSAQKVYIELASKLRAGLERCFAQLEMQECIEISRNLRAIKMITDTR